MKRITLWLALWYYVMFQPNKWYCFLNSIKDDGVSIIWRMKSLLCTWVGWSHLFIMLQQGWRCSNLCLLLARFWSPILCCVVPCALIHLPRRRRSVSASVSRNNSCCLCWIIPLDYGLHPLYYAFEIKVQFYGPFMHMWLTGCYILVLWRCWWGN
jgi:hypothetical protein